MNDSDWGRLSTQSKGEVMQAIADEMARRDGRPSTSVELFFQAPDQNGMFNAGAYNRNTKTIGINTHLLEQHSFSACLDTIQHESRHAYQDLVVRGELYHPDKAEAKAWRDNMNHYISADKNPRAHYRQPIESDAREYATITTRQVFAEQKVQHSANKGINTFLSDSNTLTEGSTSGNKGIQRFMERTHEATDGNQNASIQQTASHQSGQNNVTVSANKGIQRFMGQSAGAGGGNQDSRAEQSGNGQRSGSGQER